MNLKKDLEGNGVFLEGYRKTTKNLRENRRNPKKKHQGSEAF
jgi:hypothetical protein